MSDEQKFDLSGFNNVRVDLSELIDLTNNDSALISKYIGIFLKAATGELNNLQQALTQNDANLLYSSLHILKPQIELMGITGVLPELKLTESTLREKMDITEEVKKSAGFIFTEITLACSELEYINKQCLS